MKTHKIYFLLHKEVKCVWLFSFSYVCIIVFESFSHFFGDLNVIIKIILYLLKLLLIFININIKMPNYFLYSLILSYQNSFICILFFSILLRLQKSHLYLLTTFHSELLSWCLIFWKKSILQWLILKKKLYLHHSFITGKIKRFLKTKSNAFFQYHITKLQHRVLRRQRLLLQWFRLSIRRSSAENPCLLALSTRQICPSFQLLVALVIVIISSDLFSLHSLYKGGLDCPCQFVKHGGILDKVSQLSHSLFTTM